MFLGRKDELKILNEHYESGKAELVIIYGRRRIGKSEIIKHFIKDKPSLYFEAIENVSQKEQINHFLIQLAEQLKTPKYDCKTWREVFDIITDIIKQGKWVVAFDEFPWMASKKGALVSLLKYYWDQKWKANTNLMLIICGSVASFMIDHIIHSKALHNRKTLEMKIGHLPPDEVRVFLGNKSAWETALFLMCVGGVPKYLEVFDPKKSAKINFNKQFFTKNGFFINEFETIFKEQFRTIAYYESIVRLLSEGSFSLTEIGKKISFESGGALKKYLRNLEGAGFIEEWGSLSDKGTKTRTKKYKLIDPFLRVHFRFIEPNKRRIQLNAKDNLVDTIMGDAWYSFFGQAFDWLVYAGIEKIAKILEIPMSDIIKFGPFFRQKPRKGKGRGVQIDLLLVRKDDVITVVENKFTKAAVGSYIQDEVQSKIDQLDFPKSYTVEKVLISASGVTKSVSESGYFARIITLEELFD